MTPGVGGQYKVKNAIEIVSVALVDSERHG